MPLNEAGPARSNLTKQQKHEALAAIYGLQETPMNPSQGPAHFSAHEIERMRTILAHHDATTAKQQEFDLNNPPRTNYVHQEFPKLVYDLNGEGKLVHKVVNDRDEHEAALADGWANEPKAPVEADEIELDAATTAEVAAVDAQLKKKTTKKRA